MWNQNIDFFNNSDKKKYFNFMKKIVFYYNIQNFYYYYLYNIYFQILTILSKNYIKENKLNFIQLLNKKINQTFILNESIN